MKNTIAPTPFYDIFRGKHPLNFVKKLHKITKSKFIPKNAAKELALWFLKE